jgi:Flp pilus assembly secretin CpaC/tetratricopeptide (TPR) repeat protein
MRCRLSLLLLVGVLAAVYGCTGSKNAGKGDVPPPTAADMAVDELLAEVAKERPSSAAAAVEPAKVEPAKAEPPVAVVPAPPKTEPPKAVPEPPVAVTPEPSVTAAGPVAGDGQGQLDKLFAEMAEKDEGAAAKAETLFQAGRKLYEDTRYEEALEKFEEALRIFPRHQAAADYASKTRGMLTMGLDPMKVALEQMEEVERIRVQESLARVQAVIDAGNRFRAESVRSYPGDDNKPADEVLSRKRKAAEQAVAEYDRALEIIRWLPYQVDLTAVRRMVTAAKSEVQLTMTGLDSQLAAYRRDQAEKAQLAGRDREQMFFASKIKAMLDRAELDLREGRFEEAEAICEHVMRLDTKNGKALALRDKSRDRRHRTREAQTYLDYQIEFRGSMQSVEDATIPHSKVLVYPDNWQKVMLRSQGLALGGEETEPEWMAEIRRRLEKKVNFEFIQAPLVEAINFLQSVSEVNMILDPAVKAGGERPITLKMSQASLKLALEWILKLANLDYELRDNAVFISNPGEFPPETTMQIYDVQDLILAIPDFPGPELELTPTGSGGAGALPAAAPQAATDEAQIVDMIKRRIRPDSWAANQNTSIEPRNGKLVVVQKPEVHRMIGSLLSDLRSTQKVLVVVEGRLLTIREGLFEDIGVDWGTTGGLPEVPTATPGAQYTRGLLTSVGSVINNNLGLSPDRTDIASLHRQVAGVQPQGGLSAEFNFLNSLQLNAVLHAMRIKENGAILQAPKLVVHNGQRAHMWIGTQQSYVSGWTGSGNTTTPQTNQLLTGVVFDVRPIVSANRRYITLELRPTFTELIDLGENTSTQVVNVDDDDDDNNITDTLTTITALPDIRVTRVRTTVTIPDGGIILTGGRMRDVQFEAESGIPVLKDIPFLGRAFRWNRKDNMRENLAILVTARTLLFEEEERKQY